MDTLAKEIIRKFPPNTKFISLFGAVDTVNENDEFYIDGKDGYILGKNQYRLIFSNGNWAEIINN